MTLSKTVAAQALQADRGARGDVCLPADHQAAIAAVSAGITGGHGIVGHSENQAGIGALVVIANDIKCIVDLQDAGRIIGDSMSADVDVVIEQLVTRAKHHVRPGVADLADVVCPHTCASTGARQPAEQRARAAVDYQVLRRIVHDLTGDDTGVGYGAEPAVR
ncbi:hypothetical protein D3C77_531150 [compost metagenome]